MILAVRTDRPEAELYIYDKSKLVDQVNWLAHRELSDTLLLKIEEVLTNNGLTREDLTAIIVYEGPGSFTGLRIGLSIANALSYSLQIPITSGTGESWREDSIAKLSQQTGPRVIIPQYGSEPNITKPRK